MKILFSDEFRKSVKKFGSIGKSIQKKVDMIVENPIALGEPLKGNFRGLYSCPVKRSFLIIYLYCYICRKKKDNEVVSCADCEDCPDQTIKFVLLGPHDNAYEG
jgi:mRNA-degrading endonuclease YafQ of YafQ-DinJ toxin-antitoxin module